MTSTNARNESVVIIGAGPAGLITAYTLLQDGFKDVQILTRDSSPGGVWSKDRVYPGLYINNVHGEFRFSPMPMPPPSNASETGGRLSGDDMQAYMERFANKFLSDKIRYETEVLDLRRKETATGWLVKIQDKKTRAFEVLEFARIVLCSGGCSSPIFPQKPSLSVAREVGFRGPVLHSMDFRLEMDNILSTVKPISSNDHDEETGHIVLVGGGKSAQDIAAYLANQGRKVSLVSEKFDAFLAVTSPLPDFVRKSRFLGTLSPHIELRTRLEQFFHTTWIGGKIVHLVFNTLAKLSFSALQIPKDSPLRSTQSLFWGVRTNDEGVRRANGFHALVNEGKINVVAPARVETFGSDGCSVILDNGKRLPADAVVLCTGYTSSWPNLFTEENAASLGIGRHPPQEDAFKNDWKYTSLVNSPPSHPDGEQWASSIYRGIVPAKNINNRDFAINGAVASTNNGYTYEVCAHWISSYFLGDKMRLPSTPEEAFAHAERHRAWTRKRYPGMLLWANESYGSELPVWNWAQGVDALLDDMEVPSLRSGGNWLTWPFKVVDLGEISTLSEERRSKRGE